MRKTATVAARTCESSEVNYITLRSAFALASIDTEYPHQALLPGYHESARRSKHMQKCERSNELKADEIEYQGWSRVFRLCNNTVQLIVTTEVGPRILSYGFLGDGNEFYENPEHAGQCGGKEF